MGKYRFHFLRFPDGKGKAITLSYDDGKKQDVRLVELMKKYGFKGTFNLNAAAILPDGCSAKSIKQAAFLHASEYKRIFTPDVAEVACHGYRHTPFI